MIDDNNCPRCGTRLVCAGGCSAHWSNWYCPIAACGYEARDGKTIDERLAEKRQQESGNARR